MFEPRVNEFLLTLLFLCIYMLFPAPYAIIYRLFLLVITVHSVSFTAQHYYNNFAQSNDSLKSRISQDEEHWNNYQNYKQEDIERHSKCIAAHLYKELTNYNGAKNPTECC